MNTITEDYVSFETAKLLKEKRFDEKCLMAYIDGELFNYYDSDFPSEYELENDGSEVIDAPTLQMAMKWLREVHDIHIEAVYTCNYYYKVKVNRLWLGDEGLPIVGTYEYVIERGIKYCLENLI